MLTLSMSAFRGKADIPSSLANAANDPKRTSGLLVGSPILRRVAIVRTPYW